MFPRSISGLSFSKILSGISKTLGIANQIIPLYNQAKPMINNSKKLFNALKEITNQNEAHNELIEKKENNDNKKTDIKPNLPVFFS